MKKMLFALLAFLSLSFTAIAGVNINTATQTELESLNGIGPVKARAIIDYRKKNGGFKSVDDLGKVDGIGAATVANVRKDVSITSKTTVVEAVEKKTTKEIKPVTTNKAVTDKTAKETKSTKTNKVVTDRPAKEPKIVNLEKATTGKPLVKTVTK